jgi:transglutaminase-like putative cysteine protease
MNPQRRILAKSFAVIAIFAIVFFNTSFTWASNERYQGDQWALLDGKQAAAAAAQITSAAFPNCDLALADGRIQCSYHPDGTGEIQEEYFTKVLTFKGKNEVQVQKFYFLLPYSAVKVAALEILKENGAVVPVDVAANSKESIESGQMQANIYNPDSRVLEVNIPGLMPGDVIHWADKYTIARPVIPGEFSQRFGLEGQAFIRHLSLEIQAPADKPLKHILLKNEVPGTVVYSKRPGPEGSTVHHWEVTNVSPITAEPAMPPSQTITQRLLVSTLSDWTAVSKWYWAITKPHLEVVSPEMRQCVAELVSGAASKMEKIKALEDYVAKQVRYTGITLENDRPGFEPHDVKITYARKYGVCRDKAALLVAMLRMAGFEAYPVLTNVGAKIDPEAPDTGFNHAIVAVELKDGQELLLDPTIYENKVGFLSAIEENQSYLVCRPTGDDLKITPVVPAEQNLLRIKTSGVISRSGRMEARSEICFDGFNDTIFREMLVKMRPAEQRDFFEGVLRGLMPGACLSQFSLTPSNMLDTSSALRAEIEYNADAPVVFGAHKAVLTLPWLSKYLSITHSILAGASLAKRKYPLETYIACGLAEDLTLTVPDNFSQILAAPADVRVANSNLSYERHFSFDRHMLQCSKKLVLKTVEFTPPEYLQLKQVLQEQEEEERKVSVFAAKKFKTEPAKAAVAAVTPEAPDGKTLDENWQLLVKDAHSAILKVRYVRQVLSFSGKKQESEVKLPYNPAAQEVKLISAAVTSPAGERQTISPSEIHLMDGDWNAAAKRYSSRKILVANLPAVEIGSVVEVEYEMIFRGQPCLAGFVPFQTQNELVQKSFRIIAPAGLPLFYRVSGPAGLIGENGKTEGGRREIFWKAAHVAALAPEQGVPPDWACLAGVSYFVGDPRVCLQEWNQALLERAGKSEQSRKLALELAGKARTKLEAVKAIRDYIAQTIRPAGPSLGELSLDDLSGADTTLSDGYGDQADRAILFYAMLSAAGLKPEFVLATDLPPLAGILKIGKSFPLLAYSQASLVRVAIAGKYYYFNDTDQYDTLGVTAHDGQLAVVLPSLRYITIRAAAGCSDAIQTHYQFSVSNDGNTRIVVQHRYYGRLFGDKAHFFAELTPEKRAQYFQKTVVEITQGARPVGGLSADFGTYPGVEQFTVEIPHYGVADGKFLYLKLPPLPRLFPVSGGRRTLPFFVSCQPLQSIRVDIQLPPAYPAVAIAPESRHFSFPGAAGRVDIATGKAQARLTVDYRFSIQPAVIAPADYLWVQAIENSLEGQAARTLLLEAAPAR